ncbi:hypothetical protein Tco_1428568 [Tanacetum coccineum]
MTSMRSMASLTGGLGERNSTSINTNRNYYFKEISMNGPKPRSVVYIDERNESNKADEANETHSLDGTLTRGHGKAGTKWIKTFICMSTIRAWLQEVDILKMEMENGNTQHHNIKVNDRMLQTRPTLNKQVLKDLIKVTKHSATLMSCISSQVIQEGDQLQE